MFFLYIYFNLLVLMKRYTNTDNINNDLTRLSYNNNSIKKDFNNPLNLNRKLNNNDLLPKRIEPLKNPFQNIHKNHNQLEKYNQNQYYNSEDTYNHNNFMNSNLMHRQTGKINNDISMKTNELIQSKDKTIDSMNSEINKLKISLNEVMEKDKKIQELKNELTLMNKKLQENNSASLKVKELEIELKITKKTLDKEYIKSSEVTITRNKIEKIKEENESIKKKMLQINQSTNLFMLKKLIVKHTKCDLDKLNKVLEENNITEDSFILNDMNESLIKKVIEFLK